MAVVVHEPDAEVTLGRVAALLQVDSHVEQVHARYRS